MLTFFANLSREVITICHNLTGVKTNQIFLAPAPKKFFEKAPGPQKHLASELRLLSPAIKADCD